MVHSIILEFVIIMDMEEIKMSSGIVRNMFGAKNARTLFWLFLLFLGVANLFMRKLLNAKYFGIEGFVSVFILAPILLVFAYDVFHNDI